MSKPLIKIRNKHGFVIAIVELDESATIEVTNAYSITHEVTMFDYSDLTLNSLYIELEYDSIGEAK